MIFVNQRGDLNLKGMFFEVALNTSASYRYDTGRRQICLRGWLPHVSNHTPY